MRRALAWHEFQDFYRGLHGTTNKVYRSKIYEGWLFSAVTPNEMDESERPVIYFPEKWWLNMEKAGGIKRVVNL